VRLRGVRDDNLPALAKMDPGRMATLSSWVAPPSEAAAKEGVAKWSANDARHRRLRIPRDGPAPHPARRSSIQPRRDPRHEKAGFVEEGRLRDSVLHDGHWYDEVLMSILDHEWAARRWSGR
jgi:hypothetical protein